MVPDLLHVPFAIGLVLLHKAERVQCEESGILLTAVGHALVHPFDTGLHILKYGLVLRAVENFAPDALDRGADKLSLGVIIIVDRADRDPACRGDRTDTDRRPALFPAKLTAVFSDLFLGGYDCIHVVTFNMNNVHFHYTAHSHFVKRIS